MSWFIIHFNTKHKRESFSRLSSHSCTYTSIWGHVECCSEYCDRSGNGDGGWGGSGSIGSVFIIFRFVLSYFLFVLRYYLFAINLPFSLALFLISYSPTSITYLFLIFLFPCAFPHFLFTHLYYLLFYHFPLPYASPHSLGCVSITFSFTSLFIFCFFFISILLLHSILFSSLSPSPFSPIQDVINSCEYYNLQKKIYKKSATPHPKINKTH